MKHITSRSKYYALLLLAFIRISLLSQLEYKLNFISGVVVELAYMCIKLTYLVVVTRAGVNVGTLTPDMVMMFVGAYCFMTGIWMLLRGVNTISDNVITGQMDMLMVKPGSLMFLQTLGIFDFALTVPNCAVGIALICVGWARVGIPLTLPMVGGFVFFMIMGATLTYALTLIPALLVFWVSSRGGTYTLFAALWDFNNMPMALYGKTIQRIGTFIIPVFLLTNWAGLFVLRQLTALEIAWGITAPALVMAAARLMWVRGMRRYTSANG